VARIEKGWGERSPGRLRDAEKTRKALRVGKRDSHLHADQDAEGIAASISKKEERAASVKSEAEKKKEVVMAVGKKRAQDVL